MCTWKAGDEHEIDENEWQRRAGTAANRCMQKHGMCRCEMALRSMGRMGPRNGNEAATTNSAPLLPRVPCGISPPHEDSSDRSQVQPRFRCKPSSTRRSHVCGRDHSHEREIDAISQKNWRGQRRRLRWQQHRWDRKAKFQLHCGADAERRVDRPKSRCS